MKYLFVGDVHNHSYIFDEVTELDYQYNFDRIIFMGDYVDDWDTDNHKSLETLEKVIQLKKSNPDKYTLLWGNHENSYVGYKCSGHHIELEDLMEMKLKENIECFDFYTKAECENEDYYCTHAGITNDYIKTACTNNWEADLHDMNKNKLNSFDLLHRITYSRGGCNDYSSFLWTDIKEHIQFNLLQEPIVSHQIIGHSPVKTIKRYDNFIFVDTHSTFRDGSPYGDKSYLMWDGEKFLSAKFDENKIIKYKVIEKE